VPAARWKLNWIFTGTGFMPMLDAAAPSGIFLRTPPKAWSRRR